MMDWNGHMTAAGWILMILWTVIIVALIAGVIYWLTTARTPSPEGSDSASLEASAGEILDRRLARGELSVEEYERLRRTLTQASSSAGEAGTAMESAPAPG